MTRQEKAEDMVRRAIRFHENGQIQEAIELNKEASLLDPSWPAPLYNLGMLFKNQRKWEESYEYNCRATSIDTKNEAAWWNLGIAATALGRWETARKAWRAYGIAIPEGAGPIDFPCGFCPIRLHPEGDGEVVWAHRLDPARAALASIPLPESGHRWRDVVLNDGAPNGHRQYNGKEYPVFDALELLEASAFGTYVAEVEMPLRREYVVELAELAAKLGGAAEDWSTSVRMICKACSEGRPHETHDTDGPRREGAHHIGIAALDREHATRILLEWETNKDDVQVESLDDALAP